MLIGMLSVVLTGEITPQVRVPEPAREFRGVWVATVDNIDWPSKPGLSNDAVKRELVAILDQCQKLRLNAVLLQVRPSADAFYKSSKEPWSWYLTGQQGKAPADGFDPLAFAITEAHKRGIELHAWLNPYRANHPAQDGPLAASHLAKTNPAVVKKYGTYQWMDPGEKAVQDHSFDVFMDLVERYDLDGLHIDDYFYPYPVRANGQKVDFPDAASYKKYRDAGGTLNKDDWRRKNVDDFVKRVYDGIKQRKRHVKFGISPFGIYRPGVPTGIQAGIDQYADLYADARKWWHQGWLDYFSPQLYWPVAQKPQAFPVLLDYWAAENKQGRHLWPGLYTSRTDPNNGAWKSAEIIDQVKRSNAQGKVTGAVHFSMKPLMRDYAGVATALQNGPYALPAVVPASPWLDNTKPTTPRSIQARFDGTGLTVQATAAYPEEVRFFVYQTSLGDVIVSSNEAITGARTRPGVPTWVSVRVMDKAGNLSDPRLTTLD